jgi:DNA-binding GntR family transcriptional regulator
MTQSKDKEKQGKPNGRGQGAERVYRALREDILRLELAPSSLLDEVSLGARFNLSRSPVREALIRLAGEGLVKTLPNKSTLVAPLKVEEFSAYLDALDLIQRVTTRLAAKLRSQDDLKEIQSNQDAFEASLAKGDVLEMIETNQRFHLAISRAAKNRYLLEFHSRLLDEGRRFLRLYFRSFNDSLPAEFRDEHQLIIDTIAAQDEEAAEKRAHEHTLQFGERFLSYLSRRHTGEITIDPPV